VNLKKDRHLHISSAVTEARAGIPILQPFTSTTSRGKAYVSYKRYSDHLILRAIARHLKLRHRVQIPSRDTLVRGIVEGLMDGTPMFILRRDITSFYESIPVKAIEEMLARDTRTPRIVKQYFQKYFEQHCRTSFGLPRGVGLSAVLSEVFMRDFDKSIKRIDGVYRYYRFCDDILIFSTKSPEELDVELKASLPASMRFNTEKSQDWALLGGVTGPNHKPVEYLGYKFSVSGPAKNKISRTVQVGISDRKISKLKTRIVLSLLRYSKDRNFQCLRDRLRFLSSNYIVHRNQSTVKAATHVRSGIFYNYKMCGAYSLKAGTELHHDSPDMRELRELDGFYHSILAGPSSRFSSLLSRTLSPQQRLELEKLSFLKGYQKRMLVRLHPREVSQVKEIWKNV
jgi:hypothetical protein